MSIIEVAIMMVIASSVISVVSALIAKHNLKKERNAAKNVDFDTKYDIPGFTAKHNLNKEKNAAKNIDFYTKDYVNDHPAIFCHIFEHLDLDTTRNELRNAENELHEAYDAYINLKFVDDGIQYKIIERTRLITENVKVINNLILEERNKKI